MSVRNVKLELEAKLKATAGGLFSKPSGKVERKTYEDMVERLRVSIQNLKVPDNSEAVVTADGNEIVKILIVGGKGRFDEESRDLAAIPSLEPGQTIAVSIDGRTLLSGKLYVD